MVPSLRTRTSPCRWSPANDPMEEAGETAAAVGQPEAVPDLRDDVYRAVRGGVAQEIDILLQRGAQANATYENGDTLVHLAAKLGHEPIVSVLLKNGADPDAVDGRGRTPLHLAAIHGHLSVTVALLESGADMGIIFRDSSMYEHLALSFAARMGHVHVLRALLRHGADVNASSSTGLTALHYAAVRNQSGAIDVLAKADGADIEARVVNSGGGGTPLHAASVMCCDEATLSLLENGANIHAQNVFGYSPLHAVARQGGRKGAVEVTALLLRWGADETALDHDGHTPAELVGRSRIIGEHREGEEVERLRELLRNAPADRAWRRRGFLVLCRAFLEKTRLIHESNGGDTHSNCAGSMLRWAPESGEAGNSSAATGNVLKLSEEGLFRHVVGFL